MRCIPSGIFSLKKLDELYARDREQWKAATDEVGGTYSYSMGHVAKGQLVGFEQRTGLDNRPLMADSGHDRACHNSPNHSGRGQNVLFGGGHVRFRMDRKAGPGGDDIFLSQDYCKKAGLNKNDCVLGIPETGQQAIWLVIEVDRPESVWEFSRYK